MKQLKRQAELDQAERYRSRNKKVTEQSGAEAVARELDDLNAKHQRLLDMLYERLRRIAAANPGDIVTLVSVFFLYDAVFGNFDSRNEWTSCFSLNYCMFF